MALAPNAQPWPRRAPPRAVAVSAPARVLAPPARALLRGTVASRIAVAAERLTYGSSPSTAPPGSTASNGASHLEEEEDEPWTFQQFISVVSGLLGSLLTMTAFNQQRKAIKNLHRSSKSDRKLETSPRSTSVRIVQQLGGSLIDAEAQSPLFTLGPIPPCTAASDLRAPDRHFTIITTAALPWLTGTAVNPLLRALALARMQKPVIFVIPWLDTEDQKIVLPKGVTFDEPWQQEQVIRTWCRERAKTDLDNLPIKFQWYQAKYVKMACSIFPKGDLAQELGEDDPRDVLILEEPEHLCWYHHGQRWPGLFRHVIGVVHTNYQDFMSFQRPGIPAEIKEASVFVSSLIVCSAYCDVNIKLSDTIMPLPNEVTCNVHGVRDEFLTIGDCLSKRPSTCPVEGTERATTAYYLGKALYGKGWSELLSLVEAAGSKLRGVQIDGYGSGPDYENIILWGKMLSEDSAVINMHPGIDHANEVIHGYGVLVNPSTSDVLCTVTVEALAMGKRCVLARHPSNRFFEQNFSDRCTFFDPGDAGGFAEALNAAVAAGPPVPLPPKSRYILTWDAATERLFEAAQVRVLSGRFQRPSEAAASRLAYRLHFDIQQETVLRDLIKEATLGETTPWAEYLAEWRKTQVQTLRSQALEFRKSLGKEPENLEPHERYLQERLDEFSRMLLPNSNKP